MASNFFVPSLPIHALVAFILNPNISPRLCLPQGSPSITHSLCSHLLPCLLSPMVIPFPLGFNCLLSNDPVCFCCTQQGNHQSQVRIRMLVMESGSPRYNQQEDIRSHLSFSQLRVPAKPAVNHLNTSFLRVSLGH